MSTAIVTIHGFVGKDAELKYLPSGSAVLNFSIATSDISKDDQGQRVEETTWYDVAVFGQQAESIAPYVKKGSSVMVSGRQKISTYVKRDGNVGVSIKVNANVIDLGPKPGERSEGGEQHAPQTQSRQRPASQDDIPF